MNKVLRRTEYGVTTIYIRTLFGWRVKHKYAIVSRPVVLATTFGIPKQWFCKLK